MAENIPNENNAGGLLLDLVRQEAQVAVGCTEPAMIALAAARGRALAGEDPVAVSVEVSLGVMKNAQAVGLPGTKRKGLEVAAALGAVAGDPEGGLEVLSGITPAGVERALALTSAGRVRAAHDSGRHPGLYARVTVETAHHRAVVAIEGSHTNITEAILDEENHARPGGDAPGAGSGTNRPGAPNRGSRPVLEDLAPLAFSDIYRAVMDADLEAVRFLAEGAERNRDLAAEALKGDCQEAAPEFVRSLRLAAGGAFLASDLVSRVRLWTAAAVSARMGGTPWPVLTSGGSGNQGILVSVPLMLVTEELAAGQAASGPLAPGPLVSGPLASGAPVDQGRLTRALLLAHAVNLYIKAFTGEVSAVCGAVTGGAGVAAAVAWLLGGDQATIERAIQMVTGGLYATVCDGAKGSCALKIAEGAASGVIAGRLARDGGLVPPGEGVVGETIEETVRTLGRLTRGVLNQADSLLVKDRAASR